MLTTDSKQRKDTPIYSGVFKYFPLALAAVARVSKAGNDKHNPGEPLHWARDKGGVDADAAARHILELGTIDPEDGESHDVHLAWRSLANAERTEEKRLAAGRNTTVGAKGGQISVSWGDPYTGSDATTHDVAQGSAMPPPPLPHIPAPGTVTHMLEELRKDREVMLRSHPAYMVEGVRTTNLETGAVTTNRQSKPFTFWYLATPYTKFPGGHLRAFDMASRLSAHLMSKNIPVFSPIAHSHPIAQWMSAAAVTDHGLWMRMDGPLMEAASGIIVVTAESWEKSSGMREEVLRFNAAGKPIVYWNPACPVPKAVLDAAIR